MCDGKEGDSTHRLPTKCLPEKCATNGFGAVRLIRLAGWNFAPGPLSGGPSSMLQEEGASTEVMGMEVSSRAEITVVKGGRGSPENEKPEDLRSIGGRSFGSEGRIGEIYRRWHRRRGL